MLITTGKLMLADNKSFGLFREAMYMSPTMICLDMDEEPNQLINMFPQRYQKFTLLCPPPSIMYKAIDGDEAGFAEEYDKYLESKECRELILVILKFLSIGGQGIMYIPETDDLIWVNQLLIHLFTNYGLSVGTTDRPFMYDARYDDPNSILLYTNDLMNTIEFLNIVTLDPMYSPLNDPIMYSKVINGLSCYTGSHDMKEITDIITNIRIARIKGRMMKPAVRYMVPIGDEINVNVRPVPRITEKS